MNATTFVRIVVPACLYAVAGLLLVSFANERFQLWFDTGYTLTSFERFAYCAAFILSFPIATWACFFTRQGSTRQSSSWHSC